MAIKFTKSRKMPAPSFRLFYGFRHELDSSVVPPFVHGAARSIGTYKGVANTCPDGRVNAWEATVPNGLYLVTSSGAGLLRAAPPSRS